MHPQQQRKALLRKIVMDILTRREPVSYECNQFAFLRLAVKEVLVRRKDKALAQMVNNTSNHDLPDEDDKLLLEIFWDLFVEQVITLGLDSSKPGFPFFRLHSKG